MANPQSPGRFDLRGSGGGQAIGDGTAERLRRLLDGGGSQAGHGGGAQLHPGDRGGSGRTETGRHHV